MRSPRLVRHALTVAGVAGLTLGVTLPASAPPAAAAASPGWRVVKTLGPFRSALPDSGTYFAATSASDAWYIASALGLDNKVHVHALHWNGRSWRQAAIPARLDSYARNAVSVAASSARNLWVIGSDPVAKALRWNGRHWFLQAMPRWAVYGNLSGTLAAQTAVFSDSNVWLFSEGQDKFTKPDHYAARYNGHRWSKMTIPVLPDQVSAVSPDDIWVFGQKLSNLNVHLLAHWNGHGWQTVRLPAEAASKAATRVPSGVTALGPRNVWLSWFITAKNGTVYTKYLSHWDGRTWHRVYLKYKSSLAGGIVPDGHGGIWMVGTGPAPDYREGFYHLNGGHWTRYLLAAGDSVLGLTHIPRTRSLWAQAETFSGTTTHAKIMKFGR